MRASNDHTDKVVGNGGKRLRKAPVSQTDVPAYSLTEALRVPQAVGDNYAFQPTAPINVALAMGVAPNGAHFKMLCGAAIAYGLCDGGYNAAEIAVTPLARRVLEPTEEGDDVLAKRSAFLKPRVLNEFMTTYNRGKFPKDDIAANVLVQMGVPRDRADDTLRLIKQGATDLGLIQGLKGAFYVNLEPSPRSKKATTPLLDEHDASEPSAPSVEQTESGPPGPPGRSEAAMRRVFITHGRNTAFIEPLKDLLAFGEMEPIVSVERESVALPVPDKVMADMRSCGAAIIHVDAEELLLNKDGGQVPVLNPNVFIEIGAAMALYGRRFILLTREGVKLPSNLQGLYEVRYDGEKLDGDTTIRLLRAIKEMKNHALPESGFSKKGS